MEAAAWGCPALVIPLPPPQMSSLPRTTQGLNPVPSSSYIHSSMYGYFSFPRKKGLLGSDPSKGPFQHQKVGRGGRQRGSRQGKRGASQYSDGKCREEGDWEKNNSNKHFMKQKMAYKEVNF